MLLRPPRFRTDVKNRPEQLNLPNDPAFLPELDINLDLSLFDLPPERSFSRGSSQLPSLVGSSHASFSDQEPQLELPSDETSGPGIGGFDFGASTSSVGQLRSNMKAPSIFEEPGIIDDPDLDIDADGNLFTPTQRQRHSEVAQSALASLGIPGSKAGDSTGITDRVRAEHEAGLQGRFNDQAFDFKDQPVFRGDDEPPLPDAAPFSARHPSSVPLEQHLQSSSAHPNQEASSVIEAAPQRRIRTRPAIKVDLETQIHNTVLKAWDVNYRHNMAADRRKHDHFTSTLHQAKKNAEDLVLGIGLSGLGREFDDDLEHPLRKAFGGQALFDLLTGRESTPAGKKRGHTSNESDDEDEEDRRTRLRSNDGQEVGRGEHRQYQFDDVDGILAQGDDYMVSSLPILFYCARLSLGQPTEIGRHAPSSLPDVDSIRNSMPWNILSSRAGSAHPPVLTSSIGAFAGGFEPAYDPPSTRGHRLTSASPLFGRGKQSVTRYSSLEIPGPARTSGELLTFDDNDFQLPDVEDEEFEIYGPAAGVSTQLANNSQWLANTLEDEANNFFAFLQAEIEQRHPVLEKPESQELGSDVGNRSGQHTVTFNDLLPPASNTKVVGAQGLLHVLTLVTRGAVTVKQEEDFGDIEMSIVPGVRLVEREQNAEEVEGMSLDDQAAGEPTQGSEDNDHDVYDELSSN